MAIEGFDYKGFATSMAEQAKDLAPKELKDFEKEYIVKTLGNFTMLAGEALYNDESLNITADQAIFITQIIAEWSFHKSVDLIHSGILPEYWDSIMQKIAFTIFEIAKIAITKNLPKEQLLQAVEFHVVKVYKESIEELQKRGIIDEEIKKRAESQSNIDDMAQVAQAEAQQQAQQQAQAQQNDPEAQARKKAMIEESERNRKEAEKKRKEKQEAQKNMPALPKFGKAITHKDLKLMTLAVVLKVLSQDKVTTILDKFNPRDSKTITGYMNIANLESQVDGDLIADYNLVNRDIDNDAKCEINCDLNGDGYSDINIDLNGDNVPNYNIDITGDNVSDANRDTNGDGIADMNLIDEYVLYGNMAVNNVDCIIYSIK